MNRTWLMIASLCFLLPVSLTAGELEDALAKDDPPDCPAQVSFLDLRDGDVVPTTFDVQFVVTFFDIAPAGVAREGAGHHHLLIDMNTLPPLDMPLPMTDQIIHYGGGETSTQLTLAPGEHTLQLLMGDHMHVPHNPPVLSPRITITVVEEMEEG